MKRINDINTSIDNNNTSDDKVEDKLPMKESLLHTVKMLREEKGINFKEQHPLFQWSYEEEPTLEFQLLIKEINNDNEVLH